MPVQHYVSGAVRRLAVRYGGGPQPDWRWWRARVRRRRCGARGCVAGDAARAMRRGRCRMGNGAVGPNVGGPDTGTGGVGRSAAAWLACGSDFSQSVASIMSPCCRCVRALAGTELRSGSCRSRSFGRFVKHWRRSFTLTRWHFSGHDKTACNWVFRRDRYVWRPPSTSRVGNQSPVMSHTEV